MTAPRCQVCRIPEGRRYSKVITTESVRQESKKTRACLSVLNADTLIASRVEGLQILCHLKVRDVMHEGLVCGQG